MNNYNDTNDDQVFCNLNIIDIPRMPEGQILLLNRLAKEKDPNCPHEAWLISLNNHSDYYSLNKDYTNELCRICNQTFSFNDEAKYWEFVMEHAQLHLKEHGN